MWYPHDIEAYRLDTRHLSCLEHGAYRQLLDEYFLTRQPLPDDDRVLARICGLSLEEWQEIAPAIRAFFKPRGGLLIQKRASQELDAQDRRMRSRSERAKKAAAIRHSKSNGLDASALLEPCSSPADALLGDATKTKTETDTPSEDLPTSHFNRRSPRARARKKSLNAIQEEKPESIVSGKYDEKLGLYEGEKRAKAEQRKKAEPEHISKITQKLAIARRAASEQIEEDEELPF